MGLKRTAGRVRTAIAVAALSLVAISGTATAALLPPLPSPPGVPSIPLPTGTGTTPAPASSSAAARPSRSPPSVCPGASASGPVAALASVFPCDFPDPMVLRVGGTWYAYASATGWEPRGASFPVLRSSDLLHWTAVGNAFTAIPPWVSSSFASQDLWGPSVIRWGGRYLMFYNATQAASGLHCLAVAGASQPQGPFQGLRRIVCARGRQRGFIDPAPLVVGHRLYLFFSVDLPRHTISALPLSPSGLMTAGRIHQVLGVSPHWGHLNSRTVEGPWPMRHDGVYYLFYSAGSWDSDYRMSFARASTPLGPYTDSAPVRLVGTRSQPAAPGGGSLFSGPGGSTWLAFAAWSGAAGYTGGSERTLRVAPLSWTPSGRPRLNLTGWTG